VIDPFKVPEFEQYAKMWIPLVNKFGGTHHGYWLPYEGANNIAIALFSFPSLKVYEEYRMKISNDEDCKKAFLFNEETRCIKSIERSFMKPLFE
jgi:hypothetical protein